MDKHTALLLACLYRGNDANGEWGLSILGKPEQGRVVLKNIGDLQFLLQNNPPQIPTALNGGGGGEDVEIDLQQMPAYVPIQEDTEIDLSSPIAADCGGGDNEIDLSAPAGGGVVPNPMLGGGRKMDVQVPPGYYPGMLMQVQDPETGNVVQFGIPQGLSPGNSFTVQF